ncbi:hypothetical protein [Halobaculum litoreum]|uniref:hypothetical protein n=1 Tax=Halobaculum litoreum TaxID=3031998 RepID=UPI0024C4391B|nr:hypothetical protein [Halobaculum sp. DT92]
MPAAESIPHDPTDHPFEIHHGTVPALTERADRTPASTELVLTPTRLHRRNLRDRLRRANAPQSVFTFAQPLDVARRLAGERGARTECLDRVDRLYHLEVAVREARDHGADWHRDLAVSMGTDLADSAERVEHLRAEVETTTGFHPDRLASLRAAARDIEGPDREDALARIDAAVALQRTLADRTDTAPSADAITRGATRELAAEGQPLWNDVYADIERVTVAGVSTLGATLVDFLGSVGRATDADTELRLHLRHATGEPLAERLPDLCSVERPGATVIEG